MTYRERAEARLERRRQWAAGRRDKANVLFARGDPYRGDIAFNTQPGHIPERARVIRAHDKACKCLNMADHHDSKAAGIEEQLKHTVFSDDENAIETLQTKINKIRALVERMKTANKIIKKYKGDQVCGKMELIKAGFTPEQAEKLYIPDYAGRIGFPSYALTNEGANARRMEKRIEDIKRINSRTERAKEAPDGYVIEGSEWVRITFAEKPEKKILDALRAARFIWGSGCWTGERANIPACLTVGLLEAIA